MTGLLRAFPVDSPRHGSTTATYAWHAMVVSSSLWQTLRKLAGSHECAPCDVVQAAFFLLLARYTATEEPCIVDMTLDEAAVDGSWEPKDCAVPLAVVQSPIKRDQSFEEYLLYLAGVRRANQATASQVNALHAQASCVYIQPAAVGSLDQEALPRLVQNCEALAVLALHLVLVDAPAGLQCIFLHRSDLISTRLVTQLGQHLLALLREGCRDPRQPAACIPMLSAAELQTLLIDWNQPKPAVHTTNSFVQHFSAQAARTPDAVAVLCAGAPPQQTLTYRQLDECSTQLAHVLRRRGIGLGERPTWVGVCLERSCALTVSLIGILKAGGAFCPLDPELPARRMEAVVRDAQPCVIIATPELASRLPPDCRQTAHHADPAGHKEAPFSLLLLDDALTLLSEESTAVPLPPADREPDPAAELERPAYVIYTSGSTGRPKGVLVSQRALVHHNLAAVAAFALTAADRVLQNAALGFDVALEEMFPTWLAGATVVFRPSGPLIPIATMMAWVQQCGVTLLNLPASYFHEWAADCEQNPPPACLRLLIVGSDKVRKEAWAEWHSKGFTALACFNAYGTTETAITSTLYQPTGAVVGTTDLIPIGRPLPHARLYVMDPFGNPVPVGATGELYVGGIGIASGYLNLPELTAKKFIRLSLDLRGADAQDAGSPSSSPRYCVHEAVVRTGDHVRYLPDGNLEYLGRTDAQAKIRGFRVEPDEITEILLQHPEVQDATVAVRADAGSEAMLVAYLIPRRPPSSSLRRELAANLREQVPSYMVPAAFEFVERFPRKPSGKVDAEALPPPTWTVSSEAAPPRTPIEKELTAAFEKTLNLPHVSTQDSFFDLGGNSLLACRLLALLNNRLGRQIPIATLLQNPSVSSLAATIDEKTDANADAALDTGIDWQSETAMLEFPQLWPVAGDTRGAQPVRAVFLTGATGLLGAHLLAELLRKTSAQIYCLVRAATASSAQQRLLAALQRHGLNLKDAETRVTAVPGDLSQPQLGLTASLFDKLAHELDAVFHCGAWVNFIYPYRALRPCNVEGTREALRLCLQGRTKPFHFVSTLSVFPALSAVVSEEDALPDATELEDGYAQSKWVAEQLVMRAADEGAPVTIHRPSRIIGLHAQGVSPVDDLFHRTIQSNLHLGIAAEPGDGEDNLIPVDFAAQAITHLSLQSESLGKRFHIVNPANTRQSEILEAIGQLGARPLSLLPVERWIAETMRQTRSNPNLPMQPLLSYLADRATAAAMNARTLFAYGHTSAGLLGKDIVCPRLDAPALKNYFGQLLARGWLSEPISGRQAAGVRTIAGSLDR